MGTSTDGRARDPDPPKTGLRPWIADAIVPAVVLSACGSVVLVFDVGGRWCAMSAPGGLVRLDEMVLCVVLGAVFLAWTAQVRLRTYARLARGQAQREACLSESRRELESFSYAISHDLRAPLRILQAHLTLMRRRLDGRLSPEDLESFDHAVTGAEHLDTMLHALLDYARAGDAALEMERIDLDELVDSLFDEASPTLREVGGTVARGRLPTVTASRPHLTRVLRNLLDNAIKYRRPDRPLIIRIDGEVADGRLLLRVSDNGMGIPHAARERVFKLFQRLEPASGQPGVGLGLTLCRRIVERHGGGLDLAPGSDDGCTFVLTLPA